MFGRSRHRERILLPGESEGRRSFLKYGLAGGALLALGGGTFLATRRTRPASNLTGPFSVLSPEEATVFMELSERLLPPRPGFPAPLDVELPKRIDALLGLMPVEGQREVKQLVGLFENALAGFLLDGQWRTFTASNHEQQDARIRAWQRSRFRVRRTGFRAFKKIVYSSYYGAPETWPALGYPGPPPTGGPVLREPRPGSGTITEGNPAGLPPPGPVSPGVKP
ncbi:MAG: hypothetical protein WCK73_12120 [Deltaproteobacteria bacterium]